MHGLEQNSQPAKDDTPHLPTKDTLFSVVPGYVISTLPRLGSYSTSSTIRGPPFSTCNNNSLDHDRPGCHRRHMNVLVCAGEGQRCDDTIVPARTQQPPHRVGTQDIQHVSSSQRLLRHRTHGSQGTTPAQAKPGETTTRGAGSAHDMQRNHTLARGSNVVAEA
jgi:hypothetical protein